MIEMEIAKSLGLKVTGTIGLIYIALKQGIADGNLEEIVLELKRSGVWISEEIIEKVKGLKI
jgi:predicted nucleic acid-binding protein